MLVLALLVLARAMVAVEVAVPISVGLLLVISQPICLGVGVWSMLTYAGALAAKIPDSRLAKHVRMVAWGFLLCFFILLLLDASRFAGAFLPGQRIVIYTTLRVLLDAGFLILGLWTLPLLAWLRRRLREAAEMSQDQLHSPGSPRPSASSAAAGKQ